jgi:hypothetical protein
MLFQHASDDEFVRTVEAITGRVVRAFVSGIDTGKDVSAEVFYLRRSRAPAATGRRTSFEPAGRGRLDWFGLIELGK